jgi:DNA-binding MarR family transcriptional regulator
MSEEKELKVLEFLRDGEKSTSEIASLMNRDFYYVTRFLEEMEQKGMLEKIPIKNFTYWKLKNGNRN